MPFEVTRAETDGDGLTLEGYAAVWDSPTEIKSAREGNFIERMKPGSFKKTLDRRTPVLMFDHGNGYTGPMPIGKIEEAREDARGLYIRARLSDNWLVQPIRDCIAMGAIDGMSFRMSIPDGKETWRKSATRDGLPERDIHEVNCPELGPVVFPAYEDTSVSVRSQEIAELLESDEVRSDLARALFMHDRAAPPDDEERMDMEAAQLALRDAIKLHQAQMAGGVPTESQQQLLNHLLNARAVLSGGQPEMKSEETDDLEISRDDTAAEDIPEAADDSTSDQPEPTEEVTPRGASDPQEQRTLRLLEAQRLGVKI
jgi:HK97 family phage prohead protease